MTEDELVMKYKHIVGGIIFDGLTNKITGAGRSMLHDQLMGKVETLLRAAFKDAQPASKEPQKEAPKPANGAGLPQPQKVKT